MPNNQGLYMTTFSSSEFKTVGDYLSDPSSLGFAYNQDPNAFLAVVGRDGLTNRQRIENSFKTPEEKRFIGASANNLPLKTGMLLYVEQEKANRNALAIEGIEVVSTDEPAFKAAQLAAIEADPGYFQVNTPVRGQKFRGTSQEMVPEVTVWIWCRALSTRADESGELKGQFFDLSPFVQNLKTNMGKNGGNFQITLPPLICTLDSDNKWVVRPGTLDQYENGNKGSLQGQGYISHGSLLHVETIQENPNKAADDTLVRSQFLFHNIISSNDLILIRFETLDMEQNQRYTDSQNYNVNKNNIAGRIYDMIGLVDTNTQTTNAGSTDVSINITGRDLSKLFIEDGTYFYALENSGGLLKFAGQSEQKNGLINRIFGNGALNFIGLYTYTSIETILKFIIQQLSNIKVVPNDLFTSYGDRRNNRFDETESKILPADPNTKYKKQYKPELASGIWQIVKLVIDQTVSNRRLCDSSFSTANGSLLNFIHSAAQEPLVEYYADTYGDMYNLIVRQPPYAQKALISLIEGKVNTEDGTQTVPPAIVDIEQDDVILESLGSNDGQVFSWYNFFPKNNFFGEASNHSLTYLGALYFPEYAKTWGSRSFNQVHPYLPFAGLKQDSGSLDILEKQAIEDLKYVVESSQYLPFTRSGTLVLNGDRRLKIGNVIRYKPTGEIFFIDQVQQSYSISENSIDRTTTLKLSRGMVEQLIYGAEYQNANGVAEYVGYFNIINTNLNFKDKTITTQKSVPKNSKTSNITPQSSFQVTELRNPSLIVGISALETYDAFPANKDVFIRFLNGITDSGYKVYLSRLSANRTSIQQAALKKANPLNAMPGSSTHEVGRAIDISVTDVRSGKSYSKNTAEADWRATGIPGLANSLGLQWGGPSNDGTFGSYIDRVHFQLTTDSVSNNINNVPVEYETVTVKTNTVDRDAIFSNFKVNQFVFNFFLKSLQFDPSYRNVGSRHVLQDGGELLTEATIAAKRNKK